MEWRQVVVLTGVLNAVLSLALDTVDLSNMSRREVLTQVLDNRKNDPRIPPDYDKDVATNVTIQMHIVSFHSVNEVAMDFTMTFYLRRKWIDERLSFPAFQGSEVLELDNRLIDRLWVPDIFFRNEKSAAVHNVTVPNRLIHIFRNGTIMYSSRMSMTLSCPMDLLFFPMDVQECPVVIQSYAYSTSNVMFHWMDPEPRSITLAENWEMAHVVHHKVQTGECEGEFERQFACVMATFRMQRHLGYFLVHVYLPTVLVVILSWVSFWIDAGATPARITIGVMSVLTMATQSSTVQNVLPRVSYVKAIDVWMATCVGFVFAALLEFAYVNVLTRRKNVHYAQQHGLKRRPPVTAQVTDIQLDSSVISTRGQVQPYRGPCPRQVDKISRLAFPSVFGVFCVCYWTVYIVFSKRQSI